MGSSRGLRPADLARALVAGARRELDLTPKPGLVDQCDNGSHPDLTYEAMVRSIELLPIYYEELLMHADGVSLDACIRAGRAAEQRMFDAIGTNAHKGYIFLSGVALLAAGREPRDARLEPRDACLEPRDAGREPCEVGREPREVGREPREVAAFRMEVRNVARRFFGRAHPGSERGGIRAESLAGLPCIFEHGMPGYAERLARTEDPTLASFDLMARLMVHLEDTTAIRRCGAAGLETLRTDGRQILAILDAGEDPVPHLAALNTDYRRRNLTMGGVADCMALCFALTEVLPPDGPEDH